MTDTGSVAEVVRRRRQQLDWSQSELARRSGVSRFAVNGIEGGHRMPSVRTYEKLRTTLGLHGSAAEVLLSKAAPATVTEQLLSTLAAGLLVRRAASLADLAEALEVSIPAVREAVRALESRLAACGLAAVDDGVRVELVVLPHATAAVSRLSELEVAGDMTRETIEVLIIVGTLREATRRQIEERRLQDSAGLLERMVRRGLLEKRSEEDQRGQPNAYRLTARALGVVGHGTIESFEAWCAEQMARAQGVTSPVEGSAPGNETAGA